MTKAEIEQEMGEVISGLDCRDKLEELNCKSAFIAGRMSGMKEAGKLMIESFQEETPVAAKDGSV